MKQLRKSIGLVLMAMALVTSMAHPAFALEADKPVKAANTEQSQPQQASILAAMMAKKENAETAQTAPQPTVPEETAAAQTEPEETVSETTVPEVTEETIPEITLAERLTGVPLYYQNDYANVLYGTGTVATEGCGLTSLAMVATYLTGHTYTPADLANWFSRYEGKNNMDRLEYMSDQLQLPWKKAENWHQAKKALEEGCVLITLMNNRSDFTLSQHFIVLTGISEDGRVLVNDPDRANYDLWELKPYFRDGFPDWFMTTGYDGSWIYDPSAMPETPFIYEPEQTQYVEPRYPEITLSASDVRLLAKMVWVESRGEPFEGQQAVAEVVLNRLASDHFQSSIYHVIHAENQFRSAAFLEDAEPTHTQFEAVRCALNGPYVLPKDVMYFATYSVNDQVWGQIGGHTFCYEAEEEAPTIETTP